MTSDGSWQRHDADPDAAFWSGETDRRVNNDSSYGYHGQTAPSPQQQPYQPQQLPYQSQSQPYQPQQQPYQPQNQPYQPQQQPAMPYPPTPYPQQAMPQRPQQDQWSQSANGAAYPQMAPYQGAGMYPRPDHPNATTSLVLGILGLFVPVLSPIALALAFRGRNDIRQRPGVYNETSALTVGLILGGVGTALLALWVLYFLVVIGIVLFA